MATTLWTPAKIFLLALLLRLTLLLWGLYQDAHSPLKYTDIDYLVFTDAARFLAAGGARSPYDRATYRYTPLLAWLVYPTTFGAESGGWVRTAWFAFGKVVFAAGDLGAGWGIYEVLRRRFEGEARGGKSAGGCAGAGTGAEETTGGARRRAVKFAAIWLLNPMVANISTRGSSEGLLAVIVVAVLWAALERRVVVAGALLGLGVHFKIYPFVYAASVWWWLGTEVVGRGGSGSRMLTFFSRERLVLGATAFATFMALNVAMYQLQVRNTGD